MPGGVVEEVADRGVGTVQMRESANPPRKAEKERREGSKNPTPEEAGVSQNGIAVPEDGGEPAMELGAI